MEKVKLFLLVFLLGLLFGFIINTNNGYIGAIISKITGNIIATINNPSFENGDGVDAFGWQEGLNYKRSNDRFKAGSYSMRIAVLDPTISEETTLSDAITVEPGMSYILSGFIYNHLTQGQAYLDVKSYNGQDNPTWSCDALSVMDSFGWQYVSCVFTVPSDTTQIQLRLIVDNYPQGIVWFDEVAIKEYSAVTTTTLATTTTTITTSTTTTTIPMVTIFSEDFETDLSQWQIKGTPQLTTAEKHGGLQSVKIPGNSYIFREDNYNFYFKIDIYFFDSLQTWIGVNNRTGIGLTGGLVLYDNVYIDSTAGNNYFLDTIESWPLRTIDTQIPRTYGWHKITFERKPYYSSNIFIDDIYVASTNFGLTGIFIYNNVTIVDAGVYVDDVSLSQYIIPTTTTSSTTTTTSTTISTTTTTTLPPTTTTTTLRSTAEVIFNDDFETDLSRWSSIVGLPELVSDIKYGGLKSMKLPDSSNVRKTLPFLIYDGKVELYFFDTLQQTSSDSGLGSPGRVGLYTNNNKGSNYLYYFSNYRDRDTGIPRTYGWHKFTIEARQTFGGGYLHLDLYIDDRFVSGNDFGDTSNLGEIYIYNHAPLGSNVNAYMDDVYVYRYRL